jgi:hypothetical protein
MISIQLEDNLISATVIGEFTLSDFKEFEQTILHQLRFGGKPLLMLDLRGMLSYTMDMAWEEIKFSRSHSHDFSRIAVLTESQWVVWSAWLSRLFVDAEVLVFDDDLEAKEWLTSNAS